MFTLLLATLVAQAAEWPDLSKAASGSGDGVGDAAVVVGIDDYFQIADVPGAVDNANDWYSWLTKTRGIPTQNVTLLRNGEGTIENMRKYAKDAASQAQAGGKVWFVFIGHGAPTKDGKDGVLVGVDAARAVDGLFARSLPRGELETLIEGPDHDAVLIVDSCFSGKVGEEPLISGLQFVVPDYASRETGGMAVLTAGRSDQFAGSLPGADRPAFTYLLLGALRGWGDKNRDGQVTLDEAITYTNDAMRTVVRDRSQQPEAWGGDKQLVLGAGRETGPRLEDMVLAQPGSGLTFGTGVEIRIPEIKVAPGQGLGIHLDAERALARALEVDGNAKSSPEARAEAWCGLASVGGDNPYLGTSSDACRKWKKFTRDLRMQEAQLVGDYQKLVGYLPLSHLDKEHRRSAVGAFLKAYEGLIDNTMVTKETEGRLKNVLAARDSIEKSGKARLAADKGTATASKKRSKGGGKTDWNEVAFGSKRSIPKSQQPKGLQLEYTFADDFTMLGPNTFWYDSKKLQSGGAGLSTNFRPGRSFGIGPEVYNDFRFRPRGGLYLGIRARPIQMRYLFEGGFDFHFLATQASFGWTYNYDKGAISVYYGVQPKLELAINIETDAVDFTPVLHHGLGIRTVLGVP